MNGYAKDINFYVKSEQPGLKYQLTQENLCGRVSGTYTTKETYQTEKGSHYTATGTFCPPTGEWVINFMVGKDTLIAKKSFRLEDDDNNIYIALEKDLSVIVTKEK